MRINIAGLYYHTKNDRSECGTFEGYLKREPDNPHDHNAVKVEKKDGCHIGYIPRKQAPHVGELIGMKAWPCIIKIWPAFEDEEESPLEGCVYFDKTVKPSILESFKKNERRLFDSNSKVEEPKSPTQKAKEKGSWLSRLFSSLFSSNSSHGDYGGHYNRNEHG